MRDIAYIVLDYFEHFFYCEVLYRLKFAILSAPRKRLAVLCVGLELKQRIVDAVK